MTEFIIRSSNRQDKVREFSHIPSLSLYAYEHLKEHIKWLLQATAYINKAKRTIIVKITYFIIIITLHAFYNTFTARNV